MRPSNFVLLIITFIFINYGDAYTILDHRNRPLLSYLLDHTPPSKHVAQCLEPLRKPINDFMTYGMTVKTHSSLCMRYKSTLQCVDRSTTKCSAEEQRVVQKLTTGFKWACNSTVSPLEPHLKCMVALGKEARHCSQECHFGPSILAAPSAYSKELKLPNVFERYEHVCEPLACYLNCTALQINAFCPMAGTHLIHMILNAFDILQAEFAGATPEEKQKIKEEAPEKCRRWFSIGEITNVRVDRKFVATMFFLIGSMKQDPEVSASEAERIVVELLSEVEANQLRPPVKRPTLDWDWSSGATFAAIVTVMVLNIVGLVFTIWWCVTTSQQGELGEPHKSDDIAMSQFLEPNIRMKLKLPKMRSDAIHDSCHEVLELRVPRNGNQYHQNDEQTVVVPRNKRRRTYSVPLEPRPRTQSTGSEQSSQILILRNHENC